MGLDGTGWEAVEVWSRNLLAPGVRLGSGRRLLFWPAGCIQRSIVVVVVVVVVVLWEGEGGGWVLSDRFVGWEGYVSSRGDLGRAFLGASTHESSKL